MLVLRKFPLSVWTAQYEVLDELLLITVTVAMGMSGKTQRSRTSSRSSVLKGMVNMKNGCPSG